MEMENGKTLSKNLLYTPLAAYLEGSDDATAVAAAAAAADDDSNHPSQYMKSLKTAVPKSIHESSLAQFLHSVSQDYHRNRATAHDARNSGSRPLSLDDVENRVRQRAVTLLGGGVNASLPTSKRHNKNSHKKKRRRKSWSQVEEACKQSRRFPSEEMLDESAFLRQMNWKWNEYMYNILRVDDFGTGDNHITTEGLQERVFDQANRMGRFEKVGAHVRIESCRSHKAWTGRRGVIISETLRKYRVAWMALPEKAACEKSEETERSQKGTIETLVVPKYGTCLVLLLPLPPIHPFADEQSSLHNDDSSSPTIIPIADKTIDVTLKEGL